MAKVRLVNARHKVSKSSKAMYFVWKYSPYVSLILSVLSILKAYNVIL